MYNVSMAPSKIVAKTRRGANPSIDRMDNSKECPARRPPNHSQSNDVNAPRPTFNVSHRKYAGSRQQEVVTPEHEELARYVSDSWNSVRRDYEYHSRENRTGPDTVIYYEERLPNKKLKDFKPFDFESWWGLRLYNNITKPVP